MTVAHRRPAAAATPPAVDPLYLPLNGNHNNSSNATRQQQRRRKFRSKSVLSSLFSYNIGSGSSGITSLSNEWQWLSTFGVVIIAGLILLGCIIVIVAKMIGINGNERDIMDFFMLWHYRSRLITRHHHHPDMYNLKEMMKNAMNQKQQQHSQQHATVTPISNSDNGKVFKNDPSAKKWFYSGPSNKKRWPDLDPSPIYTIPKSLKHIGDKTDGYAQLRKDYDELFPPGQPERSLDAVEKLKLHTYASVPMVTSEPSLHDGQQVPNAEPYDVYNCPDTPPRHYPYTWNLVNDVLQNWPTDEIQPRKPNVYHTLCVFDYTRDYAKAMTYRKAEVPFVVIRDPDVAEAVERWNTPGFIDALMGDVMHRCEYSKNNHFMYWVPPMPQRQQQFLRQKRDVLAGHDRRPQQRQQKEEDKLQNWTAPTEMTRMRYADWVHHANVSDDKLGPDKPHWYYRLIGCGEMGFDCDEGSSEYLFDELTFFQPRPDQLYLDEYQQQKGIHCRFGMRGVIAENHYDGSRNAIVLIGGQRRYILAHPNQCQYMSLFPNGHPSARHSAVDWSQPDLDKFPQFAHARANEVVLQPGDVLYLPTNWFHYIVSLQLNYQCNTRSGVSFDYHQDLRKCGF